MFDSTLQAPIQMQRKTRRFGIQSLAVLWGKIIKRALDVTLALLGLLLLLPVFLLVAILIKRDSPGPVFYRGLRVGREGRLFRILKFRTMFETPESYAGPRVTGKEDSRITPMGAWLRNTKINELPQLWNVLTGDMSLVGPRPEDPEIMKDWPADIRDEILSVRPGITSPASVLYHSEESLLSKADPLRLYFKKILPDKMRLDQLYVQHRSFSSDLDIVFWTMTIFVPRIARTKIPEGYLFAGPFSRLFHRYVSWFLMDLFTALAATGLVALLWRSRGPLDWGVQNLIVFALALATLFSLVNCLAGLNRIVWSQAVAEEAIGLVFTSGFVTLVVLGLNYLQFVHHWLRFPALPMDMLIIAGLLAQLGFIAMRYRLRLITGVAEGWLSWRRNVAGIGERALLVGKVEGCEIASWLLKRGMFRHAFSIVGMVASDDPTKHGMRLHGCWMLGGIGDLASLVKKHDIRVIIYTIPSMAAEISHIIFSLCKESNIQLIFLDDLIGLIDRHMDRPATSNEYSMWLQERLESVSMHDALTGLPNRYLLQDRLRHTLVYAKRYSTKPAVLFINLNGFEILTNNFGTTIGDEIVKLSAKRLSNYKRESDTLARYDKHEFALILDNIPDENTVATITKRLSALMAKPFVIKEGELSINVDISIFRNGENGDDVRALRNVDIGTCYAKRQIIARSGIKLVTKLDRGPDRGALIS